MTGGASDVGEEEANLSQGREVMMQREPPVAVSLKRTKEEQKENHCVCYRQAAQLRKRDEDRRKVQGGDDVERDEDDGLEAVMQFLATKLEMRKLVQPKQQADYQTQ